MFFTGVIEMMSSAMWSAAFGAMLATTSSAAAQDSIASFVGEETAAIVRIDLDRFDPATLGVKLLGEGAQEPGQTSDALNSAAAWVKSLKQKGGKELFILIDPMDEPGSPVVFISLNAGADAQAIVQSLEGKVDPKPPADWQASAVVRGMVVGASVKGLDRVKNAKPANRPEVAAALSAFSKAVVQVVFVPSETQRRVLEESVPELPAELGGGTISPITKGLLWASAAIELDAKPMLQVVALAKDQNSAKEIVELGKNAFRFAEKTTLGKPPLEAVVKELGKVEPRVEAGRISMSIDLEQATALVKVPVEQAREAARRSICTNNLKQLALAMHNFASANGRFPGAYTSDKAGKPHLSWRVLVLPYLDQQALYNEFHLEEPWDSPHNKSLISKMPAVFACPQQGGKLTDEGKTTYLTPRSKQSIFPGNVGIKLEEITDGTSNTIMIVDANDDLAVVWSKPDDWEYTEKDPRKGLIGHHPEGTNVCFADGSVRFLKASINPMVFLNVLTRNGGEVVKAEDY
jgi:prepilin-type processing-associated H-X9-DG protein